MNQKQTQVHERTEKTAQNYHRCESELIECLQEVDREKVFQALGYASLFKYAIESLRLSEHAAYNFIVVSRKAKEIPQLKEDIKTGCLTVAKARRLTPVIKKENANQWLEKAKTLPQRKLEKEVAKISPRTLTPEKSSYVTGNRLKIELGVDEDLYQDLERVKDLLSQKLKKAVSLEEALKVLTQSFLDRQDPMEKAKRATKKRPSPVQKKAYQLGTRQVGNQKINKTNSLFGRRPIPAAVRHAVHLRDQARCAYRNHKGKRCEEKRWLDFHHQISVANGGSNHPDNLITLCQTHHRLMHQEQAMKRPGKQGDFSKTQAFLENT